MQSNTKIEILICFGTRPEAIKMSPLIKAILADKRFKTKVCVTAQHREMLDQVLEFFQINPDIDLNIMQPNQSLNQLSTRIINKMDTVLTKETPDWVIVHGDTTTSCMVAFAAFHRGIKVGHVEAGLRTYDITSPYPEELNRQITSRIANVHFTPTTNAKQNLIEEKIPENKIIMTGNTIVDALELGKRLLNSKNYIQINELKKNIDFNKKLILITGHRRENFGQGFANLCKALREIAKRDDVQLIYPVHMNPNILSVVNENLGGLKNIHIIHPVIYPVMLWLLEKSYLIISDSGGIQEEAPSLGKMLLVTRNTSERPEGIEAGFAELVGTDKKNIVTRANYYLDNGYQLRKNDNPYGDGKASQRIIEFLANKK